MNDPKIDAVIEDINTTIEVEEQQSQVVNLTLDNVKNNVSPKLPTKKIHKISSQKSLKNKKLEAPKRTIDKC